MIGLDKVLDYRLDAIGFCLTLITIAIAIRFWIKRRHGQAPGKVFWSLLVLLIGAGLFLPERSGAAERIRLRDMLSGIAPTYAQEMQLMGHNSLTLQTKADDPAYLAMVQAEIRWEKSNPNVSDIYTFTKNAEGKVAFLVDSETDYDRNGVFEGDRESRTAIGEEYPETTDGMLSALAGESAFDGVPYTDRWGTWVSQFVPLKDENGKVLAALGVDYDARNWLLAIAYARLSTLVLLTVAAVLLVASTVVVNITRAELAKRLVIERERAVLQEQLVQASRQAGMAEIATGVLHNVGNVLNSVNVSARMITDNLRATRLGSLGKLVSLVRSEQGRLGEFVTADPRGKCLPDFLDQLYLKLKDDQETVQKEVDGLVSGIEHIKEVVRMQQNAATSSTLIAPTDPVSIVEDALKMNLVSMERHHVEIVRDFDLNLPLMPLDRHKVLQILVNLISNAKKATCHPDIPTRRVTLHLHRIENDTAVEFVVEDNGIGIAKESVTKLFRHGFTQFAGGHGFGLHSGANSAKEMGGSLEVQSDGPGKGAKFILKIPLKQPANQEASA